MNKRFKPTAVMWPGVLMDTPKGFDFLAITNVLFTNEPLDMSDDAWIGWDEDEVLRFLEMDLEAVRNADRD